MPRHASKLIKILERERIFDFLAGLRPEYDEVQNRLLGKDVVPDLHEVLMGESLLKFIQGRKGRPK